MAALSKSQECKTNGVHKKKSNKNKFEVNFTAYCLNFVPVGFCVGFWVFSAVGVPIGKHRNNSEYWKETICVC